MMSPVVDFDLFSRENEGRLDRTEMSFLDNSKVPMVAGSETALYILRLTMSANSFLLGNLSSYI